MVSDIVDILVVGVVAVVVVGSYRVVDGGALCTSAAKFTSRHGISCTRDTLVARAAKHFYCCSSV